MVSFFWGFCLAAGPAACGESDGPAVAFELKQAGRVSLALYDAGGRQVRTLLNAERMGSGGHRVAWDGLDLDGKPLAAGDYTWKLLESQGLQAEYLMALGTSTGLNHWPGQHGGPTTLACDGQSVVVGGTPEGSPLLAKIGLDGTFHWNQSQFKAPEGAIDSAIDGARLYSLQSSAIVRLLDKATGHPIPGVPGQVAAYQLTLPVRKLAPIASTGESVKLEIPATDGVRYLFRMTVGQNEKSSTVIGCKIQEDWFGFNDLKPGQQRQVLGPLTYENQNPVTPRNGKISIEFTFKPSQPGAEWHAPEIEMVSPVERIDARDGALVATFPAADTLAWVEPGTGAVLEQVKIPQLRDVTLLDARTVLAISGNAVFKIGRDGSSATVISGLTEPSRLAWDAASRTLWVAEAGTSHQIKRFGADFKLQAALGRAGGRKMGLYRPGDFLDVADIAGDGAGGFVLCEHLSAPRRTAHFDRDGRMLREWFGGQQFYTFAAADPEDPTLVWMDSHWGHLMQVKVDYEKKEYVVRACYRWDAQVDPRLFTHFKMAARMVPFRADLQGAGQREQFLRSDAHAGLILKVDEAAGFLRPVAGLGVVMQGGSSHAAIDDPDEKLSKIWVEAMARLGQKSADGWGVRKLYRGFGWSDMDGSFDDTKGRMTLFPSDGHGFGGGSSPALYIDSAFTIYQAGWPGTKGRPVWTAFPSESRTPSGAPIWGWANRVDGPILPGNSGDLISVLGDRAGNIFTLQRGGGDGYVAQGTYDAAHGWQWPANIIDASAVSKWDKEGRLLWRVGPHASRQAQKSGQLHHPVYLAGLVNGAVGVCDKIISPCEFWSEDGLYIGGLLDRRAEDGLPARAYAWWREDHLDGDRFDNLAAFQYDMIVGGSLAKLANGDVVYFGAGWNNVPVYRVKGWDQIGRQQGSVKLTQAASGASGLGTGLAGAFFASPDLAGAPALGQVAPRLWFEPARKGFEWPALPGNPPVASARWTGELESKFSEAHTLSVYAKGSFRLWLGGRLIAEQAARDGGIQKVFGEPVHLVAGQRYAIQAEWAGPTDGQFHLNWESLSQPIEHIPTTALHPGAAAALPVVSVRGSRERVERPAAAKDAPAVEWIVARGTAGKAPLAVRMEWIGSAVAGRDYAPLPATVTIPAGKTEARVPIHLLAARSTAPTAGLVARPAVAPDYVLDGTLGSATLTLINPLNKRLEVARVSVAGKAASALNENFLLKLTDGSGLDRSTDTARHDTVLANAWYAASSLPDQTVLTFDLGAVCEVADVRIWNFNTRNAHGMGWGEGPSVRIATHAIRLSTGETPEGPWIKFDPFKLRRPPGDAPDPGELLPIGRRARYVRIHFMRPQEAPEFGLGEVEFYGMRP